jgi:hypothetical protein
MPEKSRLIRAEGWMAFRFRFDQLSHHPGTPAKSRFEKGSTKLEDSNAAQ